MNLCYVTFRAACAFVAQHHRHHKPPQGAVVSIGCRIDGALIGVAMLGRPVARRLDDGTRLEIIRHCVIPGHPNAASWLYTRAKRLAQALGCTCLTYSKPEEGGASLRAAGFLFEGEAGGGQWSKPSRPREAHGNDGVKHRWSA